MVRSAIAVAFPPFTTQMFTTVRHLSFLNLHPPAIQLGVNWTCTLVGLLARMVPGFGAVAALHLAL